MGASLKQDLRLDLDNVTVRFNGIAAVSGVSFNASPSEMVAIVGPNAAGKSTILNAISGLVKISEGSVSCSCPSSIAYITQKSENRRWLPIKAIDVVKMGLYKESGPLGRFKPESKSRLMASVEVLGIGEFGDKQFWELSGGQKQRVRLAQALVQDPDLLLLDEPLAGLDISNQSALLDAVSGSASKGTTVVMTTHNLDVASHCQRLVLVAGEMIAVGRPDEVLNTELLQQTFGGHLITDLGDPSRTHFIVEEHHH